MEASLGEEPPPVSSSQEFEFWMVGNSLPVPSPDVLTADELFSGGVVLPLDHLRNLQSSPGSAFDPGPVLDPPEVVFKWKDLFKSGHKDRNKDRVKEWRKERRSSAGGGSSNNAEININLWPFARSRSAGHGTGSTDSGKGLKVVGSGSGRKSSSAPCSRSNSRGESSGAPPGLVPRASSAAVALPTDGLHPGAIRAGAPVGIRLGRPGPIWRLRKSRLASARLKHKSNVDDGENGVAAAAALAAGDEIAKVNADVDCRNKVACRINGDGDGDGGGDRRLSRFRTFFHKVY